MAGAAGIKAGRAWVELGVDSTQLERGLRVASNQVRDFGKNVQAIGQTFVKFGLMAGVPFAAGAKLFSDYESQMANVKILSHASAEEFAVMGKKAKQLGLDTIFSAAQAAEAMAVFAQAQLSVNDVLAATGPAMDLAATGHIEVAEAAKISTGILKGMKIEVSELPAVIDVLAAAATTSMTDIGQLGEAFRFIGPVAKAAGVNLLEVTAAVMELSDANIPGEMSGTALRGMLLSLLSPTSEAAKQLAAMGIQLRDGNHNFVGLASTIDQFQSKLRGLGDVDKLEMIGKIFPDRQTASAAVLIANGAAVMMEKTAKMGQQAGTSAEIAAVKMDTLRGATERLMSSLEGIGIALGEAITPTLRKWGDVLVEVANSVARITEKNQEFVIWVGKLIVGAIGIGAALTAVGLAAKLLAFQLVAVRAAIAGVIFGWKAFALGLKGIKLVIPAVTIAWKALVASFTVGVAVFKAVSVFWWMLVDSAFALVAAMTTAGTSILGFSAAMTLSISPATLLVAVLGLLAFGLYQMGAAGKVLAWLGKQFGILAEGARAMADDAKFALSGIVSALKSGDVDLAAKIFWRGLDVVWQDGMLTITKLTSGWGRDLQDTMKEAGGGLAMIWISVWHGMAMGAQDSMEDYKDFLGGFFSWVRSAWAAMFGDIVDQQAAAEDAAAAARAREQERMAARVKALETYRNEMKALFDVMDEGEAGTGKAADAAVKDAEARLAVARQQLEALVNLAKSKEKALEPGKKPDAKNFPGPEPQPPEEAMTPEDLDKALKQQDHVSAKGTFMASEAFGLSAAEEIGERQVKEQKRTNEHLSDIKKEQKKKKEPQFA